MPTDPLEITADLVRCPSVTPAEGGALTYLADRLSAAGFVCQRADRGEVSNLYARWGAKGHARSFGFNGHTDVVPVGDEAAWTHPPFSARTIEGDWLYGRGATDMKSGVAAFAAAAIDFVTRDPARWRRHSGDHREMKRGRRPMAPWQSWIGWRPQGERMDVCIVGEPTCPEHARRHDQDRPARGR